MNEERSLVKAIRIDNGQPVIGYYFGVDKHHVVINFTKKDGELYHNLYSVFGERISHNTELFDGTTWDMLSKDEQKQFEDEGITEENWQGRRIWEHDIVKFEDEDYQVVWMYDLGCFSLLNADNVALVIHQTSVWKDVIVQPEKCVFFVAE